MSGGVPVTDFASLRARAVAQGPRRVVVAGANSVTALAALAEAVRAGLATPVLVGDEARVRARIEEGQLEALARTPVLPAADPAAAATRAAALAGAGEAEVVLKGEARTDQLLRAILDARHSLRTSRLLSDVLLYEDTLAGHTRLVGVTDGGINVQPSPDDLGQIIRNAVQVLHALGFPEPRVALLSATEAVSEALASTITAHALTEQAVTGAFGACRVYGPLALDNALLESAARAKGITAAVAGRADIMVAPNIEAGNILGKAVKYYAGSTCAHVVVGARVPVLIPSRVESAEDKLNSIALGVLMHGRLET